MRSPRTLRSWLAALVLASALTGCATLSQRAPTPIENPGGSATTEPAGSPVQLDENYIDPDATTEPRPTAETSEDVDIVATLDDPNNYGLSVADEHAAATTALEFLTAMWTWDYRDDSDRDGIERALPLATDELAVLLRDAIEHPLYTPEQWQAMAQRGDVGTTIHPLQAAPAPGGTFTSGTYTVRIAYVTYVSGPTGALVPRPENSRYATLLLARTLANTWLVAELPLDEAEQVIPTLPPTHLR